MFQDGGRGAVTAVRERDMIYSGWYLVLNNVRLAGLARCVINATNLQQYATPNNHELNFNVRGMRKRITV